MGLLGQQAPLDEAYGRLAQARWASIEQRVRALQLDWSRVKVYQDGLPDAGAEIVRRILAEVQSPNYDLLRWLVAQGAELIGTESAVLLREEYGHLQAVLRAPDADTRARARRTYAQRGRALLAERDAYIVRRIAETLADGEIGLLFIGAAHRVVEHLPAAIAVQKLGADGGAPQ